MKIKAYLYWMQYGEHDESRFVVHSEHHQCKDYVLLEELEIEISNMKIKTIEVGTFSKMYQPEELT